MIAGDNLPQDRRRNLGAVEEVVAENNVAGPLLNKGSKENAEIFNKVVKDHFNHDKKKIAMFGDIVQELTCRGHDVTGALARAKKLFHGASDMIYNFNRFQEKGYEIDLEQDDGASSSIAEFECEFNLGFQFCKKVKKGLGYGDEYRKFLDIITDFQKITVSSLPLPDLAIRLLGQHLDLADEFIQSLNNEKFRKIIRKRRVHHKTPIRELTGDDADAFITELVETFLYDEGKVYNFFHIMEEYFSQRIDPTELLSQVQELFKGRHSLIHEFNIFLPEEKALKFNEDEAPRLDALFVEKVKERLTDEDDYNLFLKVLYLMKKRISIVDTTLKQQLQTALTPVLKDHPDLMDEFKQLLEHPEWDERLAGVLSKWPASEVDFYYDSDSE